jgi:hypothetical protein
MSRSCCEQKAGAGRAQRHGKVYNHSKRMKEKRAVLDGVAAELRRIIGKPATQRLLAA